MDSSTDLARFRSLLEVHGGLRSRWPAAARGWAEATLARSAEARAALALQQRVEALLDADVAPSPSRTLESAIMARAPRSRQPWHAGLRELWDALGGMRVAGPALAAALLVGLSLGVAGYSVEPFSDDDDEDLLALSQLSGEYLDY